MAAKKKAETTKTPPPPPASAPSGVKVKTTVRAGLTAKVPKAPAVKKGQLWESGTAPNDLRRGRVTGFDTSRVNRLVVLEPVSGMSRTSRVAVSTLQKRWRLVAV